MPVAELCPSREQWQGLSRGEVSAEQVEELTRHLEGSRVCGELIDLLEERAMPPSTIPELHLAEEPCEVVSNLIQRLKGWLPSFPQAPERIGRLGHYRLLRLLGSGGMGAVYLAQDETLPRQVAVKILLARPEIDPDLPARFRREAEAIARLEHPNVVSLYEVGEDEGRPYLVMEHVDGCTLGQRIAQAVLTPRHAATLVEALARAVQAAHERGIVHRDLKPGNVLITVDGTVKLVDFGLAKQATLAPDRTQSGAILGTPSYMAPEQAQGREVGPPADVYGLGAVLYECLTGRPPFLGATTLDTLDQVLRLDPVPPHQLVIDLPQEMDVICLKCLEKDPTRRYTSASEFADDLHRYLSHEPIRARPSSRSQRLVKWARRKPAAAALVLACAVFVLLAASGGVWHYTRLSAALKRAEEGETKAIERSERITKQYREATATISQMFAILAERKAQQIPELQEAQQAQLEAAIAFFEQATHAEERPAPEVLLDLALFSGQIAHYQVHAGKDAVAEKNLRRAIAIFEPHVGNAPQDYKARGTLASYYTYLGAIRTRAGQCDEAEMLLRRSVELSETLIRDDPDHAGHKNGLAEGYHNLGNLCLASKKPAAVWYEKAAAIRREQISADPNDSHRLALAEHLNNLGLIYGGTNQPEKALSKIKEAIATLEPLARKNPGAARIGSSLGDAHVNLGMTLLNRGRVPEALVEYTRGLEEYRRVQKREPTYSLNVLSAHGGRAQCLTDLKRYSEALPEWDRVVELADAGVRPQYRIQRAMVLVHLGEFARAAKDADEVAQNAKSTGPLLYDSACVFGLCATGESQNREAHARRAIAALEAARKFGYFDKAATVAQLKKDTDLDSLRERADYKAFLRLIEARK